MWMSSTPKICRIRICRRRIHLITRRIHKIWMRYAWGNMSSAHLKMNYAHDKMNCADNKCRTHILRDVFVFFEDVLKLKKWYRHYEKWIPHHKNTEIIFYCAEFMKYGAIRRKGKGIRLDLGDKFFLQGTKKKVTLFFAPKRDVFIAKCTISP